MDGQNTLPGLVDFKAVPSLSPSWREQSPRNGIFWLKLCDIQHLFLSPRASVLLLDSDTGEHRWHFLTLSIIGSRAGSSWAMWGIKQHP